MPSKLCTFAARSFQMSVFLKYSFMEKIIILDFGLQTTLSIARRLRELNTYCEIVPYNKFSTNDSSVIGVILSGSPCSVNDSESFQADLSSIEGRYLLLDSALLTPGDMDMALDGFLRICGAKRDWTPASFIQSTIEELKMQLGNDKVILALSGGVDSSVCAVLLHRAIGKNLTCIFVNHGLLRKNEFENVLENYKQFELNVLGIDARDYFYTALEGEGDPEKKRKIIGKAFIDIFDREAQKLQDVQWLAQGTIYPDVIESLSTTGTTIKSHHNVGGLPEKMRLKLVEPLRLLFKDEVRKVGRELGMDEYFIKRHPFPGPGLGVRILGDITREKVRILQEADDIFVQGLRDWNLYDKVWQAGAILLPVRSVGVTGDERTYENAVVLRAVNSTDAMTADWARLPYEFLAKISNEIINKVQGINRVAYDVSSKPPATIEWE
jgi:GMP synthase (glutamine-hydrolysing)